MKVAFYDAKSYDREFFDACLGTMSHGEYGDSVGYAVGNTDIKYYETRLSPDTASLAAGCDAVCVFVNDDVGADTVDALHSLGVKLIALRCSGFNNVDVKRAYGKIHVVRVPAYSPYAVAEHAMAMLLALVRRIHKAYNRTRDYNFSLQGLTGFELHSRTVGVVGTGKIGRVFIDICRGFGMKVIAYDKYPAEGSGIDYVSLDELFSQSDIISLHCPLTEETYHMIGSDAVSTMKKGVVIVNTSRGALIDSKALLEGIKDRHIGAACMDVYEEESDIFFEDRSGHIIDDDTLARLISMPNVLVTSHQAFLTKEALASIAEVTLKNIAEFFATGRCQNELCYHCGKVDDCRNHRLEKCF